MQKMIVPAAVVLLLLGSRAHAGAVVLVLISAGVPVALGLTAAVGWLLWRAVRDSMPPPAVRELPERRRAEIRVIRGELEDGKRP